MYWLHFFLYYFSTGSAGVRGWGLINGLVLKEESPVLAGAVVAETTELGLLLVPAGLKVKLPTAAALSEYMCIVLRSTSWHICS